MLRARIWGTGGVRVNILRGSWGPERGVDSPGAGGGSVTHTGCHHLVSCVGGLQCDRVVVAGRGE